MALDTLRFIWNHPITSKHRTWAIGRYLRWQLGTLLLRQPVIVEFVGSSLLVCERSMTGATGNVYCGLHEFSDMAFLLHVLRETDAFVDVGANVGSYSLLASGVVGARSLAIEPVPRTFHALRRNIVVNELSSLIEARCVAMGASAGTARMCIDRDAMNQIVDGDYLGTSLDVQVLTLDIIANDTPAVLWKVDVEGFEPAVLAGASSSLGATTLKAVLLEADSGAIARTMEAAGFRRASYFPFNRTLIPLEADDSKTTVNHLWIRDFEWVQRRCLESRSYTVHGREF